MESAAPPACCPPDSPGQGPFSSTRQVDPELWFGCAGPLVSLPRVGSYVVYFPEGHVEQFHQMMMSSREQGAPEREAPLLDNPRNVPAHIVCRLVSSTLHAEDGTCELFARITLQPVHEGEVAEQQAPDVTRQEPASMLCKVLTASDTSPHGGFSIPRRAADSCLPPLDYSQNPPSQILRLHDIVGHQWTFRHIYRGSPKRHLLTTGWSNFVTSNHLIAGNAILIIRGSSGLLQLGARRAERPPSRAVLSAAGGADTWQSSVLDSVASALASSSPFTVVYSPRSCASPFVVPYWKHREAMALQPPRPGMRFKMAFETEEGTSRRFRGTVDTLVDASSPAWPGSQWRTLKVLWDESVAGTRQKRVCVWEIEPVVNRDQAAPPSRPKKRARVQPPDQGLRLNAVSSSPQATSAEVDVRSAAAAGTDGLAHQAAFRSANVAGGNSSGNDAHMMGRQLASGQPVSSWVPALGTSMALSVEGAPGSRAAAAALEFMQQQQQRHLLLLLQEQQQQQGLGLGQGQEQGQGLVGCVDAAAGSPQSERLQEELQYAAARMGLQFPLLVNEQAPQAAALAGMQASLQLAAQHLQTGPLSQQQQQQQQQAALLQSQILHQLALNASQFAMHMQREDSVPQLSSPPEHSAATAAALVAAAAREQPPYFTLCQSSPPHLVQGRGAGVEPAFASSANSTALRVFGDAPAGSHEWDAEKQQGSPYLSLPASCLVGTGLAAPERGDPLTDPSASARIAADARAFQQAAAAGGDEISVRHLGATSSSQHSLRPAAAPSQARLLPAGRTAPLNSLQLSLHAFSSGAAHSPDDSRFGPHQQRIREGNRSSAHRQQQQQQQHPVPIHTLTPARHSPSIWSEGRGEHSSQGVEPLAPSVSVGNGLALVQQADGGAPPMDAHAPVERVVGSRGGCGEGANSGHFSSSWQRTEHTRASSFLEPLAETRLFGFALKTSPSASPQADDLAASAAAMGWPVACAAAKQPRGHDASQAGATPTWADAAGGTGTPCSDGRSIQSEGRSQTDSPLARLPEEEAWGKAKGMASPESASPAGASGPHSAGSPTRQRRSHIKVHKSGSLTRSVNLSRYSGYSALQEDLAAMFNIDVEQLRGSSFKQWQLMYADHEGDLLLVGDEPWQEFLTCVKHLRILAPTEMAAVKPEAPPEVEKRRKQ